MNLYSVYKSKIRKYGMNDSQRFRDSFVDAINRTYAEFNSLVFGSETLGYIDSFDDIIDTRLTKFTTITYDDASNVAAQSREFWTLNYWLTRESNTNGLTDTIVDDSTNVVVSIANNVVSVLGDSINVSATIPDTLNSYKLSITSSNEGFSITADGETLALTGDSIPQAIGVIDSHIISATSGLLLTRTSFLSSSSLVWDFLLNEGTATCADSVTGFQLVNSTNVQYDVTIVGGVWKEFYTEPSTTLSNGYQTPFNAGIDFHLQDGGEWSIEPEADRERKWYNRELGNARHIMQNTTTYTGPLGI